MSEDQDLLARIGQLAGHINLHKSHTPTNDHLGYSKNLRSATSLRIGNIGSSAAWNPPQSAPYPTALPRAVTPKPKPKPHRNRSLILNKTAQNKKNDREEKSASIVHAAATEDYNTNQGLNSSTTSWIAKRDRHMQLIHSSIFDKETSVRKKAIDETRQRRALQKDHRERYKLEKHLQILNHSPARAAAASSSSSTANLRRLKLNGLTFQVHNGGSKLLRIRNGYDSAYPTPKKANVGGVLFFRSRSGNLYRSGIVKANRGAIAHRKISKPCKRFSITGNCSKGPLCPYIHNPDKVAICKDFLQKGACPAGGSCDLSHEPSPHRVPPCMHFLRGKCSNSSCRYSHVHVNPAALVCRDFALLGYCERGALCNERHAHECPYYANNGACGNKNCHLPHIDRAGQIRKHAAKPILSFDECGSSAPEGENASDLLSDEEDLQDSENDDIDSNDLDDDPHQVSHYPDSTLDQQQDYFRF